jgi:hypothetical protein
MSVVVAEYRKLVQFALTLGAALLVLAATQLQARADTLDKHMIVIPASDGYGFDDCLGANKSCGKVIADAWCEAHGMAASVSFGRSDDVTASAKDLKPVKMDAGSFIVTCADVAAASVTKP